MKTWTWEQIVPENASALEQHVPMKKLSMEHERMLVHALIQELSVESQARACVSVERLLASVDLEKTLLKAETKLLKDASHEHSHESESKPCSLFPRWPATAETESRSCMTEVASGSLLQREDRMWKSVVSSKVGTGKNASSATNADLLVCKNREGDVLQFPSWLKSNTLRTIHGASL